MNRVYLDYNAAAPIRAEAAEAVVRALALGGNPSSVHAAGRAARALVERARGAVAALAGADDLVFTSGGTEANGLAIDSAVACGSVNRLIVSAVEHDSVIETARATGLPVELLPVEPNGVADLGWLEQRLKAWTPADGRPFLAVMLANNETGVLQPVTQAARLIGERDGLMHVDAVQAAGKVALGLHALGADTLSLSAHKLGGPQGVGALAFGPRAAVHRRTHGGGQERGLRGGTENVAGIAGFGAAAMTALGELSNAAPVSDAEQGEGRTPRVLRDSTRPRARAAQNDGRGSGAAARQGAWRDAAAERLKAAGALVVGEGAPRVETTLCIAAPEWPSALQVMTLDLEGVMVSAGSACSSGKVKTSAVLSAMGYGALAEGGLRASGGWATTEDDWIRFADVWLAAHARHAARHGVRRKEYA